MRKQTKRTSMIAATLIGAMMALPMAASAVVIDLAGYVDPVSATITPGPGSQSTITNLRYHLDLGAMSGGDISLIQFEFEEDIFDLSGIGNPALISTNLPGWTGSSQSGGGLTLLSFTASTTPLTPGNRFSFTLDNVLIVNAALTSPNLWDEGQIWGQSFAALGFSGQGIHFNGGSTAPVPEPGTWLLMGTGLLGLAMWRRHHRTA